MTLIDGLEWCGLLRCFISCLDSHADGTHSLQCNDTFLQICSDEESNILDGQVSNISENICFWVNYCFNYYEIVYILNIEINEIKH